MDRQRNRIRFTRLALFCIAGMATFAIVRYSAQAWWRSVTTDGLSSDQAHDTTDQHQPHSDSSADARSVDAPSRDMLSGQHHPVDLQSSQNSLEHPSATNGDDANAFANALPWGEHPLDDVLDLAREALDRHRQKHHDYTANLIKTERIGKKLFPSTKMAMKLRYHQLINPNEPRAVDVYFRFLEPRNQAGREVIYAPTLYDGKIKAHESGFLGLITVELTPNSQLAMRGNRYPITEVGLEKLIVKLIEKGERDRMRGPCSVVRTPGETVNDRACELIEVIHEQPTYMLDDGREMEHEFYKAQIWFDAEELVPIKYASFLWPIPPESEPTLEEEYSYTDIRFNTGLTDEDFDIANPKYKFP